MRKFLEEFVSLLLPHSLSNRFFPRCGRCTKRFDANQLVDFKGLTLMCEPCENVASYYWDQE